MQFGDDVGEARRRGDTPLLGCKQIGANGQAELIQAELTRAVHVEQCEGFGRIARSSDTVPARDAQRGRACEKLVQVDCIIIIFIHRAEEAAYLVHDHKLYMLVRAIHSKRWSAGTVDRTVRDLWLMVVRQRIAAHLRIHQPMKDGLGSPASSVATSEATCPHYTPSGAGRWATARGAAHRSSCSLEANVLQRDSRSASRSGCSQAGAPHLLVVLSRE